MESSVVTSGHAGRCWRCRSFVFADYVQLGMVNRDRGVKRLKFGESNQSGRVAMVGRNW